MWKPFNGGKNFYSRSLDSFWLLLLLLLLFLFLLLLLLLLLQQLLLLMIIFPIFVNVIEINNSGLFLHNLLQIFSKFCSKLWFKLRAKDNFLRGLCHLQGFKRGPYFYRWDFRILITKREIWPERKKEICQLKKGGWEKDLTKRPTVLVEWISKGKLSF